VVGDLPPSGDGSSYVLWSLSRFGDKRAVGVFDVRGDGVEVLRDLPLGAGARDVAGFAVTAEPVDPGDTAPAAPGSAPLVVGLLEA
jgi:hypothetical protein